LVIGIGGVRVIPPRRRPIPRRRTGPQRPPPSPPPRRGGRLASGSPRSRRPRARPRTENELAVLIIVVLATLIRRHLVIVFRRRVLDKIILPVGRKIHLPLPNVLLTIRIKVRLALSVQLPVGLAHIHSSSGLLVLLSRRITHVLLREGLRARSRSRSLDGSRGDRPRRSSLGGDGASERRGCLPVSFRRRPRSSRGLRASRVGRTGGTCETRREDNKGRRKEKKRLTSTITPKLK
jgi:hypothetical protein